MPHEKSSSEITYSGISQLFAPAVSAKVSGPKTAPVSLLLRAVVMGGTEHQVGISESQGYLHNQAENKQNTGTTSPACFLRY